MTKDYCTRTAETTSRATMRHHDECDQAGGATLYGVPNTPRTGTIIGQPSTQAVDVFLSVASTTPPARAGAGRHGSQP